MKWDAVAFGTFVRPAARSGWVACAMAGALWLGGCATPPPSPQPSAADVEALKRVRFEDSPEGARAVLDESILFKFGLPDLESSADPVLDALKPAIAKARGMIIVEGHADGKGSDAVNLALTRQRAEKIRTALIARQVPPDRVVAKPMGKSTPRRKPELTDEDRRLNRRAEIVFAGETVASLDGKKVEQKANSVLDQLANALGDLQKKMGDLFNGGKGDAASPPNGK